MKPQIGHAPCSAFPGLGGPGAACRRPENVAIDQDPVGRARPNDCTRSPFPTLNTPTLPQQKVQTVCDSTSCRRKGIAENP